jgi:hypothetical protein
MTSRKENVGPPRSEDCSCLVGGELTLDSFAPKNFECSIAAYGATPRHTVIFLVLVCNLTVMEPSLRARQSVNFFLKDLLEQSAVAWVCESSTLIDKLCPQGLLIQGS